VTELADAFSAFRKGMDNSENKENHSMISTEVLLNSLTKEAHKHYKLPTKDASNKETKTEHELPTDHYSNDMMREDLIINKLYEMVKTKMRSRSYTLDALLSETNLQENTNQNNIRTMMIEKVMQEMHEDLSIGFKSTESQLEMLKTYGIGGTTQTR